jgi:succinate dehydrogenase / fumarate reductase flavoprotein subunit
LSGLYAAGECACVSVHGANRLGGNSLLEAVVYGKITGAGIAQTLHCQDLDKNESTDNIKAVKSELERERSRIETIIAREEGKRLYEIRDELKVMMFKNFGVFRTDKNMRAGLEKLTQLKGQAKNIYLENKDKSFNQSLVHYLELEGMLLTAEAVCLGAIARKESRGSHFRTDYPTRDDSKFLKHTQVYMRSGKLVLEYSDVNLGRFPVKERVY